MAVLAAPMAVEALEPQTPVRLSPDEAVSAASTFEALPLADGIRNRLEGGLTTSLLTAGGARVRATIALPEFYRSREFEPAWLSGSGLSEQARELVAEIRAGSGDGLRPEDYHLTALDSLLSGIEAGTDVSLRARTDAELLLTDAFLLFGSHLLQGRVSPETIEAEWLANRRGANMAERLTEALDGPGIAAGLERLRPADQRYQNLRGALDELRALEAAGGWPVVPAGPNLEFGVRDPRVSTLRSRLAASGDLSVPSPTEGDGQLFDARLEDAVRRFQGRHGLEADGVVGRATIAALNVPVAARIEQVEVNLERWRWMPEDLGERHFLVNVAGFSVELFERGERIRQIRAIVGRAYRQTPVFSATMTYMVLAPYWHVPPGIAANDQLPRIREDPSYIAAQRMTLLDASTNRPVDPASIRWEGMTGAEFNRRFRLRQDPGPNNAMGSVKFMFPNQHNVYMHDTPAQELFARETRDFSSGCIRVQGALELADYLLREDPAWTPDRIRRVVQLGVEQSVRLPTPYRVHLQYWTAWVDVEGELQFREDVYGRDPAVRRALERAAPLS